MKTRRIRNLFFVLMGILTMICCVFALQLTVDLQKQCEAENSTLLCEFKTEYYLGNEIILPETAEIVTSNGKHVIANNPQIIYPNGITLGSGLHVLNQKGVYRVIYFGLDGNQEVTAEKQFIVSEYTWSHSTDTSASFGRLSSKPSVDGINIDLADGDVFSYLDAIDVSNVNSIEVCTIYPDIRPSIGNLNVSTVVVRLVDVLDPDTFVEFYLWSHATSAFYAGAGASNQNLTGLESNSSGALLFEGNTYKLHQPSRYAISSVYGAVVHGQGSASSAGIASSGGMSIRFDLKTMKAYWKTSSGEKLLTDLDAPEIYGEHIFKGFTSNQVYAQIQCYNYNKATVNIQVESLLGFSGETLNRRVLEDKIKPMVTINTEKTDEYGVYVVKGEEYTIPTDITVQDVNYNGDLKAEVFYNYGSSSPIRIYIKDGKFIPTLNGVYTLVYTATDVYGNEGIDILKLNVVTEEKAISYPETKISVLHAAQVNCLPYIIGVGVNKDVELVGIYVVDPKGGKTELGVNREYTPIYLGEHTIIYCFADNVYKREFTYKVNVIDEGNVLFAGTPKLPAYFIKGGSYILEEYYAYTLGADGLSPNLTTVQMSVDNGEWKSLSYGDTFNVNGTKNVRFKYMHSAKERIIEKKIVDLGYLSGEREYLKYFQGTYDDTSIEPTALVYEFNGEQEMETMEFINTLSLSKFLFEFNIPDDKANFSSLTVMLTDYAKPDSVLEIIYSKTTTGFTYNVMQYIDGILKVSESSKFTTTIAGKHSIFCKGGVLTSNEGFSVSLQNMESDNVLLTIELSGISGVSALEMRKLNNQNLNGRLAEQSPELYCKAAVGSLNTGDSFVISGASITSVLNCTLRKDIKLTVKTPSGTIVTSKDGIVLNDANGWQDHEIALTEAGFYRVTFTYSCVTIRGEKKEESSYIINVVDTHPPVIEFENGLNESSLVKIKIGEVYSLAKYTVTDNETATQDLLIVLQIFNEYGRVTHSNDLVKNDVVFFDVGYYTVRIWCMDNYGNVAQKYYNILVEAE
jgi:hypothetical protein